MAFSFVVEDGTGLTAATSYVSTADALTYFTVDANSAAYVALTTTQQEYYLAWASRLLDQKTDWRGEKKVAASGLRWPRTNVIDRDGNVIADTVVPKPVKDATCELARWLITNNPTAGQDVDNVKRVKVDVVELEFQDQTSQVSYPSIIGAILSGLGSFRAGAMGFARIVKV